MSNSSRRVVRKAVVGVVGGTVTAVGLALIPLPGPGTLVTAGGLAILGTEFEAPRRALQAVRSRISQAVGRDDPAPEADEAATP
jgi:uncharacterized protein (TIGR02611 family)